MCGNRSGETRISATTREGTKGRTRVVRFAWRDVLSGGVGTRRRGGFLRSGVSVDWPGACTRADLRGSMRSRRLLALRRVSTIARERVGNNEGPENLATFSLGLLETYTWSGRNVRAKSTGQAWHGASRFHSTGA